MAKRWSFVSSLCSLLFLSFAPAVNHAQTAGKLSQVRRVYVEFPGLSKDTEEVRTDLVRRLRRSHSIQIVENLAEADAIARADAKIWSTGRISFSPHSHNLSHSTFEGFLSVELVGKNNEILWSYLVTPSKFPWNGIAEDLAKQMVSKLLVGLGEKTGLQGEATSGTLSNARTELNGAGATFPAPLYQKWFESFEEGHPGVRISYKAVGSAEGLRRLREHLVDFGTSEMPLSDEDISASRDGFIQVPMVLGAVVPIYNLQNLRQDINLTPEILAGIYLGKITKWNDPQIRTVNRGAALPDAETIVVHRSDGSGTSFVWSDYLSKVSLKWKNSVGVGVTVPWPVGVEAAYNDGVAATVQRTPNSIGYVEFIYAIQHQLKFASVRNSAGEFIKADIQSVRAASESVGQPDSGFRISITNAPGKKAYPIATYTWLLWPERGDDANKSAALLELVRWMLSSGQKSCSALGYAPLPGVVAERAIQSVSRK